MVLLSGTHRRAVCPDPGLVFHDKSSEVQELDVESVLQKGV